MLDVMVLLMKGDKDLLGLCKVLEGILGNMSAVIKAFRFGS